MDDDSTIEHTPDSSAEVKDEFVPYLTARSSVVVREEPGGQNNQYSILRRNIEPLPKKGETALDRFLLLGFDTEYQPLKDYFTLDDVKKKQAFYEVLSYQLFAKIDGV